MKVNVSLEITDTMRNALATGIDGRPSKRLATRVEVREFLEGSINSLAGPPRPVPSAHAGKDDGSPSTPPTSPSPGPASDLYAIDPEDRELLRNKPPGYVYGWNKVKRRRMHS